MVAPLDCGIATVTVGEPSGGAHADGGACASGLTACAGKCVDLRVNRANCGACGRACTDLQACVAGECVDTCADQDKDGYAAATCGGADCNDFDRLVNPSVFESGEAACRDTLDNDCDGLADALDPGCAPCGSPADCDDHNACNGVESCVGTRCVGGTALDCDDRNPCTDDRCDPAAGCIRENNVRSCDDRNACTSGERCQGGACAGGSAATCTASDQCHDVGVCDAGSGSCSNPPKTDGTVCDDGNACTKDERCYGGLCSRGAKVSCDDGKCQTIDDCNPATGCTNDPIPPQPTLTDLWNGNAHWQLWQEKPEFAGGGEFFVIHEGAWYIFYRQWMTVAGCPDNNLAIRTLVRSSADRGTTWSSPQVAADLISGTVLGCVATDGDVFLDPGTGTWHMLLQCTGNSGGWYICHFTRNAATPGGPFVPDPANPVVSDRQLWDPICGGGGKSCYGNGATTDEGTPDILYKSNGYYYVTFHGWDRSHWQAHRGAAKTADFHTWITDAPDLPNDSMFSWRDCDSWNPGCVGAGAANILMVDGYHYMVVEAPNLSLGCADGQHWWWGLMRSQTLARSGSWQSWSGNPMLTHPQTTKCLAVQYANFFVDCGTTYLAYETRASDTVLTYRIYRLAP